MSTKTQKTDTYKIIRAKYGSRCAETGRYITAGETILYSPATKRTWCNVSKKYNHFLTINKY